MRQALALLSSLALGQQCKRAAHTQGRGLAYTGSVVPAVHRTRTVTGAGLGSVAVAAGDMAKQWQQQVPVG